MSEPTTEPTAPPEYNATGHDYSRRGPFPRSGPPIIHIHTHVTMSSPEDKAAGPGRGAGRARAAGGLAGGVWGGCSDGDGSRGRPGRLVDPHLPGHGQVRDEEVPVRAAPSDRRVIPPFDVDRRPHGRRPGAPRPPGGDARTV